MAEKDWTEAQKKSIYENGKNILISAAAGSGKTSVLVERVIEMLIREKSPVSVNRLLVITFTNAAAHEMKDRIRKALIKRSEEQPDNKLIKKQLALLPSANINTIHSFCQGLIKNNFYELGISPNTKIGDQTTLSMMADTALQNVMERYYDEKSNGINYLYSAYAEKYGDEKLCKIIKDIHNFSRSTPNPKEWLKNASQNFASGEIWKKYLINLKNDLTKSLISLSEIALDYANMGVATYIDTLCTDLENFKKLDNLENDWNIIYEFIGSLSLSKLKPKKKTDDEMCVNAVKAIRETQNKHIKKMIAIFSMSENEIENDNEILYDASNVLCNIVSDFDDEYSKMKLEAELMDFNDLEHMALKIIQNKPSIKDNYDEVLIDEFQDTNGVQNAIAEAVSNGNNLFMVGDIKQSIYGFRNARPDIFLERENSFKDNQQNGIEIFLSHNFRSASGVIEFINTIFSKIMTEDSSGIEYSDGHNLIYGGKATSNFPTQAEVHIINKKIDDNTELTDKELEIDEASREAIFIARDILKNVKCGLCKFSDIAVLSRETKISASVFAEVFANYGIPYYCTTETTDYLLSPEISTIISMLKIIDNPLQDIPLMAVLKSPMFLFDDNELALLKTKSKYSLYDCLNKSDTDKCKYFIEKLNQYINISKTESIEYLIQYILFDTGFYSYMGTMPNGNICISNLMLLLERANEFENSKAKSLFEFINYIDFMQTTENKYSSADTNGENDDAVKIMTIHKSKGLEFPVVYLARCGKRFNKRDTSGDILYDAELGIGLEYYNSEKNIKHSSISKLAISSKKESQIFAEEMRVLYVALTRAKQKLIITGSKLIKENNTTLDYQGKITELSTFIDIITYALSDDLKKYINIHPAEEILKSHTEKIECINTKNEKAKTNNKLSKQVADMLEYSYPYYDAKNIPSKVPISRLIKKDEEKITLPTPSFLQDGKINKANLRGSVIHFILQNIDIKKTSSLDEINKQIENMYDLGIIEKDYLYDDDSEKIYNFFNSEIGKRIKKSSNVQREVPFFAYISAGNIMEINNDILKNEQVLLQGVVDCYFEENGEIVIIDYKTGKIRDEYEEQLKYYAYGLEKTLGKKVKETHICII